MWVCECGVCVPPSVGPQCAGERAGGGGRERSSENGGVFFFFRLTLHPLRLPKPPPPQPSDAHPFLSHTMVRAIINYVKSTAAAIVR
jgi:hypothetical protein